MLELLMRGAATASGDWEFVASAATTGSVAANTSVAFPEGYQPGDAVLVLLSGYSNSYLPHPAAPPPGWEEVVSDRHTVSTSPNYYVHLLPKITGQTAYQNPNVGSALRCAFVLVVLRPVGVPVDAMSARLVNETARFQTAADAFPNPPELITTTRRNRIIAAGVTHRQAQTFTAAPGFTILGQSNGATWAIGFIAWADALQEEAGAVDPGPFPHATAGDYHAATLSLRTQVTSGVVWIDGEFASATSDLPSGTQYVASPTSISVSVEGTASIGITGGVDPGYRINGGAWTSAPGTVANGDVVEVWQLSVMVSSGQSQSNTATLTVGGRTRSFTLTTRREIVLIGRDEVWTVPTGVTALSVVGTGGGGGGGGGFRTAAGLPTTVRGGGGGGGGAMSRTPSLAVSPGDVLTLTAGPGGAAVGIETAGNPGGDSSIVRAGSTVWLARGGSRGNAATSGANGSGGAGGSATNSVGTTRYSGGNGGNGVSHSSGVCWPGGGGGGAGGYTGNGGAGGNGNNTTVTLSGNNGSGGAAAGGGSEQSGGGTGISGAGTNGVQPGGEGSPDVYATGFTSDGNGLPVAGISGGGGASRKGGGSNATGFAGGHGAVRMTW